MKGRRSVFVALARIFAVSASALLSMWANEPHCAGATPHLMNDAQPGMRSFTGPPTSLVWTVGDRGEPIWSLHVVLSELGYLPCRYHAILPTDRLYPQDWGRVPIGYWTWNSPNVPIELERTWNPEQYTEITKGAVMQFEADHGLRVDGYTGPRVRRTLELAWALGLTATHPYRMVLVDQSLPERLRVWEDGRGVVFETPCSTGLPATPTQPGIHAIFLRNREQTMQGIGPSGRPYRVEHVPYVSFFYGEQAIHGFPRQTYGKPQSAGCVELPIRAAKRVWELTGYGTLVAISPNTMRGTE
ncbi:L,D-transpeptidase [Alicyclobacillus acidocaldarius]|uniref:L,D-transpeptidase n=1 Tax=Alicyclobacillus acidocaldarius TaxID=405212 RepID=UPI00059F35B4|nr:L,D-transpeptidase family protein [Alicyclobacillus acidocaldarius]